MSKERILLHPRRDLRRVLDLDGVYYFESDGDDSWVRLASRRRIRDVRSLGEIAGELAGRGFLRVHRDFVVNLQHVREIRRREGSRGWELRLEPPVHKVMPVSRSAERALWKAFGVKG